MPSNVRIVGNEAAISTGTNGNTFFDSTLIRVLNTNAASQVITLYTADDTQYGNTTIRSDEVIYIVKRSDEKIKASDATVVGTPVGYTA